MSNSGFTFRRVREELIETLLDLGIKDFRVLDAISQVPRHIFLDEAFWSRAYENRSLTIGYKQTISQPFIVAYMTDMLDVSPLHTVLEIGTGSGYQAAVLSEVALRVFTAQRDSAFVTSTMFPRTSIIQRGRSAGERGGELTV